MPDTTNLVALDSERVALVEDESALRGFLTVPSSADLAPTEREAFLLDTLWDWREASAKTGIVLGEPLSIS